MDYKTLVGILQKHGAGTYKIKTANGRTLSKRLFSNPGTTFACEMLPRCSRKGRLITADYVQDWETIEPVEKKAAPSRTEPSYAAFLNNLNKILVFLTGSGLWKRHLEATKNLLGADQTELQALFTLANENWYEKNYKSFFEWNEKVCAKLTELNAGAFSIDEIINISRPSGVKAIPYEKPKEWLVGTINKTIKQILHDKDNQSKDNDFLHTWGGKYDYSIHVCWDEKEQDAKGYFSEEYHGCGNGYYYIMLDAEHAMFVEKD